jgi:hypothetical protein
VTGFVELETAKLHLLLSMDYMVYISLSSQGNEKSMLAIEECNKQYSPHNGK